MKVKIQGFELCFSKGIDLPEVFQIMESGQGKISNHNDDEYLYMVDLKDNYIVGLLLRFSNVKKFITTTKDSNGNLIIKVPDLSDDDLDDTEASIFCINPDTLRGAFYTYRRSLTRTLLTTFFRTKHNFVKTKKIETLKNEYSQLDPQRRKSAAKKVEEEISGSFKFSLLATQASMNVLLDSYEEISQMTVSVKDGLPDAGVYSPAEPFVKSTSVTTKFDKMKGQSFLEPIKKFVRKATGKLSNDDVLKIYGKLENGHQQWMTLGENISEFDILEFDRYVELLPSEDQEWKKFTDCAATIRLINLLKKETAIFGHPPLDDKWRLPSAATVNSEKNSLEVDSKLDQAS